MRKATAVVVTCLSGACLATFGLMRLWSPSTNKHAAHHLSTEKEHRANARTDIQREIQDKIGKLATEGKVDSSAGHRFRSAEGYEKNSEHGGSEAKVPSSPGRTKIALPTALVTKEVVCPDGSKGYLNDDYCDCSDGSDEPRTSACSDVLVHKPTFACGDGSGLVIFASRVGDGVRDCSDGSDERERPLGATLGAQQVEVDVITP